MMKWKEENRLWSLSIKLEMKKAKILNNELEEPSTKRHHFWNCCEFTTFSIFFRYPFSHTTVNKLHHILFFVAASTTRALHHGISFIMPKTLFHNENMFRIYNIKFAFLCLIIFFLLEISKCFCVKAASHEQFNYIEQKCQFQWKNSVRKLKCANPSDL